MPPQIAWIAEHREVGAAEDVDTSRQTASIHRPRQSGPAATVPVWQRGGHARAVLYPLQTWLFEDMRNPRCVCRHLYVVDRDFHIAHNAVIEAKSLQDIEQLIAAHAQQQ